MENLEQPKQESLGSKESYGKFKDADSLLKAYSSLEAEFTKKSQRLAQLESENESRISDENRRADVEKRVDEFVTKFEMMRPFSSALKDNLINDEHADLSDEAMRLVSKNYRSADDYAHDSEFLNNYIFSNQDIKDKIIKDYLSKITQDSPIRVDRSSGHIPLSPPNQPATIQEAGRLAKSIIKQK